MKILYAHRTRVYYGSATHIRALQDAFRARGHELLEVAPLPRATSIGRASHGRHLPRLARAAREIAEYTYTVYGTVLLGRAIRSFRPDFVYQRYAFADASGVLAARRHGLPVVLEVNAPFAREIQATRGLVLHGLATRIDAAILRAASRVAAVSGPLRDELVRAGVDPARIILTPNGADLARFRPRSSAAGVRAALGLRPGSVVGFVGYLRDWHRLDLALEAMARPDVAPFGAQLLLVGDGPSLGTLTARARALGLENRVIFRGEVRHAQVPELVDAFDIGLLPAVNPYASPLKLFEYLAAGKAVVAPRQRNVEEIVRDGREALLVAPGSIEELAGAIARLLRDPGLRDCLGRAGRDRLASGGFTWEANAVRIEQAVAPLFRPP